MRVFVAWSGRRSREVALALAPWLRRVLPGADPWFSEEDNAPGERWRSQLHQALAEADAAILCMTPDNVDSAWLLFEAGALSRPGRTGPVIPLLIDLSARLLPSPLEDLQAVTADRAGLWRLCRTLSEDGDPDEAALEARFSDAWPDLEGVFRKTRELHPAVAAIRSAVESVVAEKAEGFVGREWVFERISRFLEREARGYFLLLGDPGIGKSALLARMVRRPEAFAAFRIFCHFNIRAEKIDQPEQFLANVCAQLIESFGLDVDRLTPEATQNGAFLRDLLRQAAARLAPAEKILLLVDALDEADGSVTGNANVLFLPMTLPKGVYVVATSRRGTPPLRVDCEIVVYDIPQDRAENRADIRMFLESRLGSPGIRDYMAREELEPEVFVAKMVEKSQGNFMYLRHVLPEIERGAYSHRRFDTLPQGLVNYYEDHWARMRSLDEKAWNRYDLQLLQALAVAFRPISVPQICKYSGVEDRLRVQSILKRWEPFLYAMEAAGQDGKRFRFYHDSFREFIASRDEVDLRASHGRIARYFGDLFLGDEPLEELD